MPSYSRAPSTVPSSSTAPTLPASLTSDFRYEGERDEQSHDCARGGPVVNHIPLANLSSRSIKTNSKAHQWAFGAVAELVDNAKDAGAEACHIEMQQMDSAQGDEVLSPSPMMIIRDDGSGIRPDVMHLMLSMGYCGKLANQIGEYGNGFKSSSMRLGDDCLVLSCHPDTDTLTIGLYSYTFHKNNKVTEIRLPRVSYRMSETLRGMTPLCATDAGCSELADINKVLLSEEGHKASVEIMTQYTPYRSENALKERLLELFLSPSDSGEPSFMHGSQLEIYNLCEDLDFDTRGDDIQQTVARHTKESVRRSNEMMPLDTSLREYLRMLYYVPGDTHMSIHLRGHPVEQLFLGTLQGLASYLTGVDGLHYRPLNSEIENTEIALGVRVVMTDPGSGAKAIDIKEFGTLLYHKQRLVRAMEPIGIHNNPHEIGGGIVVVVSESHLEVAHNKQEYVRNDNYSKLISAVTKKLRNYAAEVYCSEMQEDGIDAAPLGEGQLPEHLADDMREMELAVQHLAALNSSGKFLVHCDDCGQWREMPQGYSPDPDIVWTCSHPDHVAFNREYATCDAPSEHPGSEDAWRRDWARHAQGGWGRVRGLVEGYKHKQFLTPGAGGEYRPFRLSEMRLPEELGGYRKNMPYNAARDALEAAVCELAASAPDDRSSALKFEAKKLPTNKESQKLHQTGPWGSLLSLAQSWEASGARTRVEMTRRGQQLEKAINRNLASMWWGQLDDEQPANAEALQEAEQQLADVIARQANKRKQAAAKAKAKAAAKAMARVGTSSSGSKRGRPTPPGLHRPAQQRQKQKLAAPGALPATPVREAAAAAVAAATASVGSMPPPPAKSVTGRERRPTHRAAEAAGEAATAAFTAPMPTTTSSPAASGSSARERRLALRSSPAAAMAGPSPAPTPLPPPPPATPAQQPAPRLHCLCRLTDARIEHHNMFVCSECEGLFHPECVELTLADLRERGADPAVHFLCEDHSPEVIARRRANRRPEQSLSAGPSQSVSTLDEMLSQELSSARPIRLGDRPDGWPRDSGCQYRPWVVWGDPKSPAEKLRLKYSACAFIKGVQIRQLPPAHVVSQAHPRTAQYGLFALRCAALRTSREHGAVWTPLTLCSLHSWCSAIETPLSTARPSCFLHSVCSNSFTYCR